MAKIIVSQFITLDGVVEDPGGSEDFVRGGWSFPSLNDEYFNYKHSELFDCGALLLGRVTYEALQAARPRSDVTGIASRMDALPKYVVSSTMNEVTWNNSTVLRPPYLVEVDALRRSLRKDILVLGSKMLVRLLMKNDLVDEFRLLLHPVVLGTGQKLFDESDMRKFKLIGTRTFATGVVVLTYVPDRSKLVEMRPFSSGHQASSSSR